MELCSRMVCLRCSSVGLFSHKCTKTFNALYILYHQKSLDKNVQLPQIMTILVQKTDVVQSTVNEKPIKMGYRPHIMLNHNVYYLATYTLPILEAFQLIHKK